MWTHTMVCLTDFIEINPFTNAKIGGAVIIHHHVQTALNIIVDKWLFIIPIYMSH